MLIFRRIDTVPELVSQLPQLLLPLLELPIVSTQCLLSLTDQITRHYAIFTPQMPVLA